MADHDPHATLQEARWPSARAAAHDLAVRLDAELVGVHELDARVLAQDCVAQCALPSFDSSAMDGWAVAGPGPWTIVGDVLAGRPHDGALSIGTCVRIATGGVVPEGATSVLRWEDADVRDGRVRGETDEGRDIRPAGEECEAGDLVARAGTRVSPALAGLLAATGHDEVAVVRRPRVALLLLGDELLTSGVPERGRVRDSLGPQLPGWIARAGAVVASARQVPDDPPSLRASVLDAVESADLVITTGGTADGPRDHVKATVAELSGDLLVDRVAVRPGHPMLLAAVPGAGGRRVPLIGLPGNPHSAIVGFVTLALPVIDAMLGIPPVRLGTLRAGEELRTPPGHTRLIAGTAVDGVFALSPYGGSAMLRGLAQSTGFAAVSEQVPAGAEVQWLPLP